MWQRYLGEVGKILSYFKANLSKTLYIDFYQNQSSIVEVMIKNFGVFFMPHSVVMGNRQCSAWLSSRTDLPLSLSCIHASWQNTMTMMMMMMTNLSIFITLTMKSCCTLTHSTQHNIHDKCSSPDLQWPRWDWENMSFGWPAASTTPSRLWTNAAYGNLRPEAWSRRSPADKHRDLQRPVPYIYAQRTTLRYLSPPAMTVLLDLPQYTYTRPGLSNKYTSLFTPCTTPLVGKITMSMTARRCCCREDLLNVSQLVELKTDCDLNLNVNRIWFWITRIRITFRWLQFTN